VIVFDLQCEYSHRFEAWFASSAAYENQRAAGQVVCPYCTSTDVGKAVMAPRIAPKGETTRFADVLPKLAALQAEMLKGSKWVGDKFATQARAMADGEAEKATIHGTATRAETKSLVDDGIGVMPLVAPVVPPEAIN
jgi:hypothetical protein